MIYKIKCPKKGYETRKLAKKKLKIFQKKYKGDNRPKYVYSCAICSQWHLTSSDPSSREHFQKQNARRIDAQKRGENK